VPSSATEMAAPPASEIRRAPAEDAGAVAQLLHDFNSEYEDFTPGVPALTERLAELLSAEQIVVLLAGDPPLGFALFRLRPSLWSKAEDAYLEELYVVPAHRGEGIGGSVAGHLDQAGPRNGRRPLRADHRRRRPRRQSSLREPKLHEPRRRPRRPVDALLRAGSLKLRTDGVGRRLPLQQRLSDHAPKRGHDLLRNGPLREGRSTALPPGSFFEKPRHVNIVIADPQFADIRVLGRDPRPALIAAAHPLR
jgi:GNAT superfamily N-acetyltransferase